MFFEGYWQFSEGCVVVQGVRFVLQYGEVVVLVVDCLVDGVVVLFDDLFVFVDEVVFGCDDELVGVDVQVYWFVGV